jgi:hypothetical protein
VGLVDAIGQINELVRDHAGDRWTYVGAEAAPTSGAPRARAVRPGGHPPSWGNARVSTHLFVRVLEALKTTSNPTRTSYALN